MVVISAGSFMMGAKENEVGHFDYSHSLLQLETPQHEVWI